MNVKRSKLMLSYERMGVNVHLKNIVSFFTVLCVLFLITDCGVVMAVEGPLNSEKDKLIEKLRNKTTEIRGEQLEVALLLRAIGRQAGVNVIVDESIDDSISLDLSDTTLYNAFQLLMETKDLRYYESNNAILIERAEDFRKDQRDVIMVRLCARYGDIGNHVAELQIVKSPDGSLTVSRDGNCLVVRDHEDNVERIKELLTELDSPQPQVHIKARIVSMQKSVSRQLGIKWGYEDLSNSSGDTFSAAVDLSVTDPTTQIVFGFIRDSFKLDLELSAMQEKEDLIILSSPRIVVLDGEEAEIKQGKEIPYESGSRENRTTSFREAVLSLNVVPKILQDKFVRLDLKVTNDSVDLDNTNEDDQPLINRQEIKTNLFLEDGVTVVVGGILYKGSDYMNEEVPFLADIPWIGNLFKHRDELDETYELLVFITPTIINEKHGFMSKETLRDDSGRLVEQQLFNIPNLPMEKLGIEPASESVNQIPVVEDRSDLSRVGGVVISPIQVKEKLIDSQ